MSYDSTLNQTATLEPQTGSDDYGNSTFGAAANVRCRVVLVGSTKFTSMQGRGSSSETETINAKARVPVDTVVENGDKFTHDSKVYKVVGVRTTPNHRGEIVAINLELALWPNL